MKLLLNLVKFYLGHLLLDVVRQKKKIWKFADKLFGFFFPQIRCSLIANMFDEEFSNFKEMMIGSWENEVKLGQLMSSKEGRAKLMNAIDFLMNDITLPEFVEFANGINLK